MRQGPTGTPGGTVVAVARARFDARRRAIRRRSLRPMLVMAIVGTVVGALAWIVLVSPVLAVDRVAVTGVSRLTAADVVAAADVAAGTPLARVDLAAVRRRVAALPPVAAVRVDRRWPHTLAVVVHERVPVAIVRTSSGVVLLDDHAVPFAKQQRTPRGTVPLEVTGAVPGAGEASARAALTVWRALPGTFRRLLVGLRATSPSAVTLTLRGGRTVVWGGTGDSARKVAVLDVLLRRPGQVLDVSAPGVAVTR